MKTLTDFFETDFVNYASYDNLRKIASYIDGQKNASRKILYTVLEKNIKDKLKVSQLGAKVSEFAEYLHGSLDGVVVNLAQDFPGTNNIPLLQKKGNFGTRFAPEASASRYIFTYGSDIFFKLFKKEDCPILISQTFEGDQIEPRFYVPTLPLILINGSEGISSGFAQKILPRSKANILKAIKLLLAGKKISPKLSVPYFEGFNGTVEAAAPGQWRIKGTFERTSVNRITITEIPVYYSLKAYIKILEDLEEEGFITSFKDLSNNDKFRFEIKIPSKTLGSMADDEILNKFKLIKLVTENFTCLDENNRIREFKDAEEVLRAYFATKLKFLGLRKDHMLKVIAFDLVVLRSKLKFIKFITGSGLKKADLFDDKFLKAHLEKENYPRISGSWDYLVKIPVGSLTVDKINDLTKQIQIKEQDQAALTKKTETQIWQEDLKPFNF